MSAPASVTHIAEIATKQDMSRWVREHADTPGIHWSVFAGPGGTMTIVETERDRSSLAKAGATAGIRNVAARMEGQAL